jgi:hypothetical protein
MPVTSEAQALVASSGRDVGVAGPPPEAVSARAPSPSLESGCSVQPRWGVQWAAQGWLGSLGLHAMLLLVLACWFFSPRIVQPIELNSELAGSPSGHPDGDQAVGGSNGSPISLAGELDAADTMISVEQPDQSPTTLNDLPKVALTPTNPLEDDASAVPASSQSRRLRARRVGIGDTGNWGAGNGEGFGLARFGNGGEVIRGVAVKVGDPQFTLIWDTKGVDIDLHVIEPRGDRIYFGHRNGKQGGELDVDNTWGHGPENIYWLLPARGKKKVLGPGPTGEYKWSVHYYAAHRPDRPPVRWQVRIKHAGESKIVDGWLALPGEWSQVYALKVHPPRENEPPTLGDEPKK